MRHQCPACLWKKAGPLLGSQQTPGLMQAQFLESLCVPSPTAPLCQLCMIFLLLTVPGEGMVLTNGEKL